MEKLTIALDTSWVVICAALIFSMTIGFALLESGLCQLKNTASVLIKNLSIYGITLLTFWAMGFALEFGDGSSFAGNAGFFLLGADNSPAIGQSYQGIYKSLSWAGVPLAAKFLFQGGFAATAITIVSGAIAERMRLINFLSFSLLLGAFGFPIVGHWVWGGGWLQQMGFFDFAGSSVVHILGGTAALAGAYFLGPRHNWKPGTIIPAHSPNLAVLGTGILWLGWWGFNSGSTMAASPAIAAIALNTNMAAAAGGLGALMTAWLKQGKPDLLALINGILGALVGITASCAYVSPPTAVIIGLISGVLVIYSAEFVIGMGIDDPVGAIAVHLFCGFWGTIALGLFSQGNVNAISANVPQAGLLMSGGTFQTGVQILGSISIFAFTGVVSSLFWIILKLSIGLRVSISEEINGLDQFQD